MTRPALSDEDVLARRTLMVWMERAGLQVRIDDAGNLYGRRAGLDPDLPPVVIGSHHDTVIGGGRFDGAYGVLAALEVVRTLDDLGIRTRHPVEVVSWTGEEGSRFAPALLGSGLATGVFSVEYAHSRTDARGLRFGDELARTGFLGSPQHRLGTVRAYIEPHIEQGPVLESEGVQVGVVEGIVSMAWLSVRFRGEARHAGTTPMAARRDAGMAAARLALAVRELARQLGPQAVATVGRMEWRPGQVNVVPGEAHLTVDVRHPDDAVVERALVALRRRAQELAAQEAVEVGVEVLWRAQGTAFHPEVLQALEAAARRLGYSWRRMPSYAGHDALYAARLGPAGMLFIPCRGGRSHCEDEEISPQDAARGANVLLAAALQLAGAEGG